MSLPRALALASVLALAGIADAAAQFPPPPGSPPAPGQASPPAAAPPAQSRTAPSPSNPFPPPPGQSSAAPAQPSAFPSQPGQARQSGPAPFAAPAAPNPFSQQPNQAICEQFPPIRAQTEKDAAVIKAASERKASREEICAAFNKFAASEGKMVKFLETNQQACGVPPDAVKQVKASHVRTQQIRTKICSAGPQGGPRAPSLSDALGGPVLSDEPPKPGRGTFDTLTGSPLSRDR